MNYPTTEETSMTEEYNKELPAAEASAGAVSLIVKEQVMTRAQLVRGYERLGFEYYIECYEDSNLSVFVRMRVGSKFKQIMERHLAKVDYHFWKNRLNIELPRISLFVTRAEIISAEEQYRTVEAAFMANIIGKKKLVSHREYRRLHRNFGI